MSRRARKKLKLQSRGTWRPGHERHRQQLRRTHEAFIQSLERISGAPIDRTAAPYSLESMLRS